MLSAKGYRVVPVKVTWNRKTVSGFVEAFRAVYAREKGGYNVIMGGSLGAMVALVSAPQAAPDELILCSLSAFFGEDLGKYDEAYLNRRFGHRRVSDFKGLSAGELASQINGLSIKATLFYGQKEKELHPRLVARVKQTASELKNARLIEIPGAGHRMYEPEYVEGLRQVI